MRLRLLVVWMLAGVLIGCGRAGEEVTATRRALLDASRLALPTPAPPTATPVVAPPTPTPLGAPAVAGDVPPPPEPIGRIPVQFVPAAAVTLTGPAVVGPGYAFIGGWQDGTPAVYAVPEAGHTLLRLGVFGRISYAPETGWLLVDQPDGALLALDGTTGALYHELPAAPYVAEFTPDTPWSNAMPPVYDSAGAAFYLARDRRLDVIGVDGAAREPIAPAAPGEVCGEPMAPPPAISRITHDGTSSLLFVHFITHVCTPWVQETVIAYDVAARAVRDRKQFALPNWSAVYDGMLVGATTGQQAPDVRWAWRPGAPVVNAPAADAGLIDGWVIDSARGVIYATTPDRVMVIAPADMWVIDSAERPPGRLVGYDSAADTLYWLVDGALLRTPAAALAAALGAALIGPPAPQTAIIGP